MSKGFATAWFVFFLVWLAASASLEPVRVIAGLIVSGVIAHLAASRTDFWAGFDLSPRRVGAFARYLAAFLRDMVKSNLAVLRYVYAPRINVAPQIVRAEVRLTGRRERLALSGTLALTPGTLPVDLNGPDLDIHVLDEKLAQGAEDSVRDFEPLLERAVG